MKWLMKNWNSLIFNISETLVILLLGIALSLPIQSILIIMLTFMVSRGFFGKVLHFKDWYRCLVWSSLILLSLFVLLKTSFIFSILFAIFSAFLMTGKSNINDMYLWNNSATSKSKYQDIIDYIKYNELDSKLLEFETKIKERNNVEYLVYKYKFRDGKTFNEMSDLLEMENPRIVEQLDKIAFAIRLYCGI